MMARRPGCQKNGASTLCSLGVGPIGRYRGCGAPCRLAHLTPQAGRTGGGWAEGTPFRSSVRLAKGVFSGRSTTVEEESQEPAR